MHDLMHDASLWPLEHDHMIASHVQPHYCGNCAPQRPEAYPKVVINIATYPPSKTGPPHHHTCNILRPHNTVTVTCLRRPAEGDNVA